VRAAICRRRLSIHRGSSASGDHLRRGRLALHLSACYASPVISRRIFNAFALACSFAVALAPAKALADDTCPVINRATAGGILGAQSNPAGIAEAELSVNWHTPTNYTCTFSVGCNTLVVTIGAYSGRDGWPAQTKKCFATPAPLSAIGNEAAACYSPQASTPLESEVISHVRDVLFDVHLSFATPPAADPARAYELLHDLTRRAADQVAGNLF
jgi:hypothetical protein